MEKRIHIYTNYEELSKATSTLVATKINNALSSNGKCMIALSGGNTPRNAYRLLASERINWQNVHIFFADERMVRPDDSKRYYFSCFGKRKSASSKRSA